jgi:HTH-type transcriptional regulator/antitoxin HigA
LEAIKLKMEELGLKNKDLQPFIGSKSYVSSILNGKREITLRIANVFHKKLGIPTNVFFNMVIQ